MTDRNGLRRADVLGSALAPLAALMLSLVVAPPALAAAKTTTIDCSKGQKIQPAIDQGAEPLVVEIRGVCIENVRIDRKKVTLHGLDPATDGIRGVAADQPTLAANFAIDLLVENLSISDGAQNGVSLAFTQATMANCRVNHNAGGGVNANGATTLNATGLIASDNGTHGIQGGRGATVICKGCLLQNNAGFAAQSSNNSLVSLWDTTVTGNKGLLALSFAYIDLDCFSGVGGPSCALNATGPAGFASSGATVAFYGDQGFGGRLIAEDRSHITLFGARQLSSPGANEITELSSLEADADSQASALLATHVTGFSRVILTAATELDGNLTCDRAGDAVLDPGVVVGPGVTVTGCEHVPPPPP